MDSLLAGYGSDSEDSSNSDVQNPGAVVKEPTSSSSNQQAQKPSLTTLLGDVSSSEDEEENKAASRNDSDRPPKKKQRRLDEESTSSFLSRNHLPSLRGESIGQSEPMISWKVDYLSQDLSPKETIGNDVTHSNGSFEKFEKLAATLKNDNIESWAAQLKSQQEFHNPHFFESVIEEFGIKYPLGSRIESKTSSTKS